VRPIVNFTFVALLTLALPACGAVEDTKSITENTAGQSVILSQSDVTEDVGDWGTFFPYFAEDTHVLKPVLVGVAKIDAGQEIHPPHRHADEEYLMVTKGRGTWYLNGVETEAKEGDILFARAWDYHGVKAAADSPLEFVVFKYSGKSIQPPSDPDPTLPEELKP
jgi:quercetin dioxygenase-like cupin family protein